MDATGTADDVRRALLAAGANDVVISVDEDYDSARMVWNGMIDRRPLAVVRCHDEDEVAAAIEVARRLALPLAVRGGGHNVAGLGTADDAVVADLSPMHRVYVDPAARLAVVQGGAIWRQVDEATQRHGLAAPSGLVSETGVAGLTLGGGLGWLRRAHGLSCDNLVAVELITASGARVRASLDENPELLWALRGGGGNFGVVTSFTFALHPVGPEVAFTHLLFDAADTVPILRALRDTADAMPPELAPLAFTGTVPEGIEGIPPEHAGKAMLAVGGMAVAPPDRGERLLAPLRSWAAPLAVLDGRISYAEAQRLFDEDYPRGRRYYWKSAAIAALTDEVIDVIVAQSAGMPSMLSTIDIWPLGGAIRREPEGGSAYAGRQAGFLVNPEANWDDPGADAANIAWARQVIEALRPFTVGTYLNFPGLLEEGESQLRGAFGGNLARLRQVKRRWDPGNLFRLNHNVSPAGKRAA